MPVYARFTTTEGQFTVRLFEEEVPNTVANFVGLAEGTKEWTDPRSNRRVQQPYYDGVIFHRVIDGFMAQTGDPTGTGRGGPSLDHPPERKTLDLMLGSSPRVAGGDIPRHHGGVAKDSL